MSSQMSLWEELEYRGFFFQCTNADELQKKLQSEKITLYLGADPTAQSLHIGNLVPLFLLSHFGKHGHTPIILVGGGTAKVGDPSGKTQSRPILSKEEIAKNSKAIFEQSKKIMDCFSVTSSLLRNNDDWLKNLHYVDFLRDIGKHFSVNRMLSFDTYKNRLESGLTFLEFNYQLLQAYDFLHLYQSEKCVLQIGGADQWANIIAGCDLIRRVHRVETFGYTAPLITRSDGAKMGKSVEGAIYCDASMTPVFDFYQYWRNVSDSDVIRFLKMYTFLPKSQIDQFENAQGAQLNEAKELLAHTVTKIIHGEVEADKARNAARAAFGGKGATANDGAPKHILNKADVEKGILFVDLYVQTKLASSKGDARRLIQQGGAKIDESVIADENAMLNVSHFENKHAMLKFGKKKFVILECE